ncbi:adenylate/guanylate cyclase domain-containing protein [Roseofilum casamattae]|uniref:Adenylate/guanylate cyclase domain-containing protein n=1 Tax=Roseofilum casamattae BLCC-M143 TaxID=3022442 RepID=A0ABT7BVJ7_9CYAN|nr:adenylate/guanylate cyclase domain-containing protein [Roseofilum casamattae]MDJ1182827.1 adenylate/guanylate cyclase domain-containing protein [Roseofilum casamattae BLCC-M143]
MARFVLFHKLSLRAVIVIPFLLQISAAVGITGYLSWRNGQQAVNELASQLRDEVSKRTEQHLRDYLRQPAAINQVNVKAVEVGSLDAKRFSVLERTFWQQIQLFPWVKEIYMGNGDGGYVAVSREDEQTLIVKEVLGNGNPIGTLYNVAENGDRNGIIRTTNPYDPRQRPWYKAALHEEMATWSRIYTFNYGALGITASEPFLDAEGNVAGVMAVDLVLSQISEFLETIDVSESGKIFILERSGLVVASSTEDNAFRYMPGQLNPERLMGHEMKDELIAATTTFLMDEEDNLQQIQSSQQFNFRANGDRQFVQVVPYQDTLGLDWLIVVVVPEIDFMAEIHASTRYTIQLCLLALLVAAGFGLLAAHWISGPIMQLVSGSRKLATAAVSRSTDWRLAQNVDIQGVAEVKVLADSFHQMAYKLQESFTALEKSNEELECRVEERTADLRRAQEKSEELLLNILPEEIARKLKEDTQAIAEYFESVTILFSDIVGFTSMSARMAPIDLVNCLNEMFSSFDRLAEKYSLEKIKTIGDAYMIVGGLPVPQHNHAAAMATMALEMQKIMENFCLSNGEPLQIRIGIHTGPVVAGVIGMRKFSYDIWGDTVNTASRMESSGLAGKIQVSDSVYRLLQDQFTFEERGVISVKGKGEMKTYWLVDG